jgi:NADPH:quinone reductase
MRAAYIENVGPPEAIRYGELPEPELADNHVLVEMKAVTVNPIDTVIRSGAFPLDLPNPFVIGRDMCGIVNKVGSGVTEFKVGDRVWANNQGYAGRQGTFAELLAIHKDYLYQLPSRADLITSVGLFHGALTALVGLKRKAQIQPGEILFLHGGSGNVGTIAVQIAKSLGARVIVTAGSADKRRWCQDLGADLVIDYKLEDVRSKVNSFAPNGVAVYWDLTKKPDITIAMNYTQQRGRILQASGLSHECNFPIGKFYTKNLSLFGWTVTDQSVEELKTAAAEINDLLARDFLRSKVYETWPISRAADAHRKVEAESIFGKFVLVP